MQAKQTEELIVSSCGSENEKGFLGTGVLASTCSTENEGKSSLGSGKGKTTSVEVRFRFPGISEEYQIQNRP